MSSRQQQKAEARARREALEREGQARARNRRRLGMLTAAILVAAVVVVIAVVASSGGGTKATPTGPPTGAKETTSLLAGIPQKGITLGNPNAPVTLVEFGDLKCPICRDYALTALPQIVQRYVRPGKVKLVWRNMDFVGEQLNPGDSPAAARFAAAAGMQNKLWQFVDLFYKNQQDESTRYVSDAFLKRLGSAVPGLDVQKAFTDRQSSAANAQLDEAKKLFAGFGFTGTPSFLLGGPGRTLSPLNVTSFDVSQFSGPIDSLLGKG